MTLQIILGFVLLFVGGETLVRGAVGIARHFKISPVVIALTIVSLGTSAPELVVCIQAAMDNHPDITVGNIIGSNISNSLLILGVAALIYPLVADKRIVSYDAPLLFLATGLLAFFCFTGDMLTKWEGGILFLFLVVYTFLTFRTSRKSNLPKHMTEEVEEQIPLKGGLKATIALIIVGTAALTYGSDILITGSVTFARHFGVSEAVISLTLIAIGTSAPELAASVIASMHKHADIAIGNVIGSNFINILLGLGLTSTIFPLAVAKSFQHFDLIVLVAVTAFLTIILLTQQKVSRFIGGLFFISYILYVVSQFPA
jgi:cation:H+ antiporter